MPLAIQGIDEAVLLWIQEAVRQAWLDPVVKAFTTLGNAGILWIVLSVAGVFWRSPEGGTAGGLCAHLQSAVYQPGAEADLYRPKTLYGGGGSDPSAHLRRLALPSSGHTCAAFSAGLVWARTLPKPWMRRTAVIQAVLMGLSRLYVGVHYPSDVLGGALVGTVCYAGTVYWAALAETAGA